MATAYLVYTRKSTLCKRSGTSTGLYNSYLRTTPVLPGSRARSKTQETGNCSWKHLHAYQTRSHLMQVDVRADLQCTAEAGIGFALLAQCVAKTALETSRLCPSPRPWWIQVSSGFGWCASAVEPFWRACCKCPCPSVILEKKRSTLQFLHFPGCEDPWLWPAPSLLGMNQS